MASPDKTWLTVTEAVKLIGCTDGWIRHLLREGKLEGWRAGQTAWLVNREAAIAARANLTTRSNAKKNEREPRPRRRKKAS